MKLKKTLVHKITVIHHFTLKKKQQVVAKNTASINKISICKQ